MNQDRICILHFIERYCLRGAEIFAAQLSDSLAVRGHRNVLCSLYESEVDDFPVHKSVDYLSLAVKQHGLPARIGFQPSALLKHVNVFRKVKPDIVIAHGADTMKYVAVASRFYPGLTTIYRNIGMASYWARSPLRVWTNRSLLKWIDAVVSVSQTSRQDIIELYGLPLNKVTVILNAVDSSGYAKSKMDRERSIIRNKFGLTEKDVVLVCVGSLSPEKNQGELLTLVHELREMSPHLILVGDGPLKRDLETYVEKLGIQERVHLLGFQPDVIPFLAASDIFLLPSMSEGMPGVLIEAGMAGLPGVAYDVGGVKEVIIPDITGIIVPPRNHEQFKAAVASLLQDPEKRRHMGSQARQKYPDRFDIKKVAEEYETLIFKLLQEKRQSDNAT